MSRVLPGKIRNSFLHRFAHRYFFHLCHVTFILYRRGHTGQEALSPPAVQIKNIGKIPVIRHTCSLCPRHTIRISRQKQIISKGNDPHFLSPERRTLRRYRPVLLHHRYRDTGFHWEGVAGSMTLSTQRPRIICTKSLTNISKCICLSLEAL